jgi:hypothetical protein
MGHILNATSRAKKQNKQKRGMWKDVFLQKAASRFHLIIICQQNTLACLSDVVYSDKQAGRKKKSLNILNHISSSKLWVKKKFPFNLQAGAINSQGARSTTRNKQQQQQQLFSG